MPAVFEKQEDTGGKIELFRFVLTNDAGTTEHLFAGSGAGPETVTREIDGDDIDFTPAEFSSPEFQTVRAGQEDEIQFEIPYDNTIATLNRDLPHPAPIALTIYHTHFGDTGYDVVWTGTIAAIDLKGLIATVRCESYMARLRKRGLQYECGVQCQYTPYNPPCPLTRAANAQTLTVTNVSANGRELTVTGASGDLKGGEVKAANGDGRDIQSHSGSVLTLYARLPAATVINGTVLTGYPSCDLTFTGNTRSCDTFAETDDGRLFGGYPHVPPEGKDPQEHGLS
jgi:hypothetical protein